MSITMIETHKANKGLYHTPLAVYFWQATLTDNSLEAYSTPPPPLKKRQKSEMEQPGQDSFGIRQDWF